MKLYKRASFLLLLGTLGFVVVFAVTAGSASAAQKRATKNKKLAAETSAGGAPSAEPTAEPAPEPAPAPAPAAVPDDLPDAEKVCKAEMQSHCLGTAPGGSRIVRCLRSNKEKNSEGCNKAMYDYLKRRFFDACGADVKKFCQVEQNKQGALMPCMQSHADALTDKCKDELGLGKPAAPAPAPAK